MASRFVNDDEQFIEELIKGSENKNTKRSAD